jgi:SAM-dependent methyltransferase
MRKIIGDGILSCPVCKNSLSDNYYCNCCNLQFPVVKNIPILINEKNSIFSWDDYKAEDAYSFFGKNKPFSFLRKIIPTTEFNYAAKENYAFLGRLLPERFENAQILIIGGGVTGEGMENFLKNQNLNFTITDVSLTGDIHFVCDGHDLPFQSDSFDCVIAQAVLEHVVDPYRCVEEIHRVLKEGGIVYAETPFMQQVHGGAYDFTRFTWLGHRRLFKKFEEIKSGTCCGPGMALSWSWVHFLITFSNNKKIAKLLRLFAVFTSFYWKCFDNYLKKKANSIDSASGNYFMGLKKKDYLLNDKELIKLYDSKKKTLS